VRELPQLPVGIGGTQALLDVEQGGQETRVRTVPQRHEIPHVGPLRVQRGVEDGAHLGIGFDREDLVTETG
jgi:hypothetical protein